MKKPKVLMLGWEFPPYKSGGLGTACYDLTKGLAKLGTRVTFVMPFAPTGARAEYVNLLGAAKLLKNVKIKTITSTLRAYHTSTTYAQTLAETHVSLTGTAGAVYGKNLYEEVQRYTHVAQELKNRTFDVIHAHDWMTYPAGLALKKKTKKPLIVHLHATEFDRTAGNPDPRISHIEYEGLCGADHIITNSHFSKQNILKHYAIPENKIEVVHWGIDDEHIPSPTEKTLPHHSVLFLGRVTVQKGPDYFVEAAKHVLAFEPNTKFIVVGDGDMLPRIINRTCELGIADKFIFTGALKGADVHRAFQNASVYVMPSVSEPFGLVALEAIKNGTPVILSKTSGVSEVVSHALKADFWDTKSLAEKIVSVLRHAPLREELRKNSLTESKQFTLIEPARKVLDAYRRLTGKH
ncbi:glycosyltransferase family 1 protein [Candidatus Woesearchaeota archaeon]|nr:MAG: glycosyltransferase family 1 protein [Candidatus Woesearchaeota archaeon]